MHGPGNEKVKCLQDPLPAHWHSSPLRTLRSMYFLSVFFNVCNPMKQIKYLGLIDWQLGKISITDSHKAQEEKTVAYWGKGEGCQVLKMQPVKIPSDEGSQLKLSSEVTKMLSLIFLPFPTALRMEWVEGITTTSWLQGQLIIRDCYVFSISERNFSSREKCLFLPWLHHPFSIFPVE